MDYYVYVLVRKDIPLRAQAVQACHACYDGQLTKRKSCNLVLLNVEDENDLQKYATLCRDQDIKFEMFYEPDYDLGWTALATMPLKGEKRSLFKDLNLWSGDVA
jgi:hypothetical protein